MTSIRPFHPAFLAPAHTLVSNRMIPTYRGIRLARVVAFRAVELEKEPR
ncbi:hypothetical protein RGE_33240 [Rubrivivax gelatinosus IL144]|uniref:Uncharacterized protein n=1 Tax=Rubrivivax gelatinosus (strain NBRC 100245 / IL144) TaxID=983917 RepID=I0HUH6_RUBGI|nr:hypothetical protein RGE_33240 [Rubrivivax gelatinosus IL144]